MPEIIEPELADHNTFGEFGYFAEAIAGERPLEMDALEGAKTVAACLAIVESAKTGKPVRPDYVFE